MTTLLRYSVSEVEPYINWLYFFHAWGFSPRHAAVAGIHDCVACRQAWISFFPPEERSKAREALELYGEARQTLNVMEGRLDVKSAYRLCRAVSDGDDLLLDGVRLPLLRQQATSRPGEPHLCLSDFVRPASQGVNDTVGIFASSVSDVLGQRDGTDDLYRSLLWQTLTDRLAEAATEKMHQYVRREAWGYAPNEELTMAQLFQEHFQGIRPAVGYPSLPDQSVNFILDGLLDFSLVGIRLTENGAMQPHASVCGLMLAHPAARYFAVGPIGTDQLEDYASRRGLSVETMRKFLAANLNSFS